MDEDMNEVIGAVTGDDGETDIEARIRTVEKEGRWHSLTDESDMESSMLIHVRGNSSRAFDKVNYRIKLTDEDDPLKSNDMPLLGMEKSSDWALHGPFLDKTLIRNYMWMNISSMCHQDLHRKAGAFSYCIVYMTVLKACIHQQCLLFSKDQKFPYSPII